MKTLLRTLLVAAVITSAISALAQSYPNRPIKLVVGFPAGGNNDFVARTLQPKLAEILGQPVTIDNKGGAGGIIAAEYVAHQPNDGYTLLLGTASMMTVYPNLYPKLGYDASKDFIPVGTTSNSVFLAVISPSVPVNTLEEFITYAKANPGKIAAGVSGAGSVLHFATELFKSQAGIDILVVPYKASGPALTDLLGDQIQFTIDSAASVVPHVKAGRMKALAVTGRTRLATLPDTPTFDEAGLKGVDGRGWQGVLVPAGTPAAIVTMLSEALIKTVTLPDVREKFTSQGLEAAPSTPEQFGARIRAEREKWRELAKTANIKLE